MVVEAHRREFEILSVSGPSIKIQLSISAFSLDINAEIWARLAQKILQIATAPFRTLYVTFLRTTQEILVIWEESRARIRVEQLIAITKIYEEAKAEVREATWLAAEKKSQLIERIDHTCNMHWDRIIRRD